MTQEEMDKLTDQAIRDYFRKNGNPIMEKVEQDIIEWLKEQPTDEVTERE